MKAPLSSTTLRESFTSDTEHEGHVRDLQMHIMLFDEFHILNNRFPGVTSSERVVGIAQNYHSGLLLSSGLELFKSRFKGLERFGTHWIVLVELNGS